MLVSGSAPIHGYAACSHVPSGMHKRLQRKPPLIDPPLTIPRVGDVDITTVRGPMLTGDLAIVPMI